MTVVMWKSRDCFTVSLIWKLVYQDIKYASLNKNIETKGNNRYSDKGNHSKKPDQNNMQQGKGETSGVNMNRF